MTRPRIDTAESFIEEHWVKCSPKTMDDRLDTLRRRANFLARQIDTGRNEDPLKREHAALSWAIAELAGIGEEVRREKAEQAQTVFGMYKKLLRKFTHIETLNAQFRVTIAALKAELHRMYLLQRQSTTPAVLLPAVVTPLDSDEDKQSYVIEL